MVLKLHLCTKVWRPKRLQIVIIIFSNADVHWKQFCFWVFSEALPASQHCTAFACLPGTEISCHVTITRAWITRYTKNLLFHPQKWREGVHDDGQCSPPPVPAALNSSVLEDFPLWLGDLLSTRSEYILSLIQYAPFCQMGNKRPPLPHGCSHQAYIAGPYSQASCCRMAHDHTVKSLVPTEWTGCSHAAQCSAHISSHNLVVNSQYFLFMAWGFSQFKVWKVLTGVCCRQWEQCCVKKL